MARKKWTSKQEVTPSVLKFREKRKWQIALRRYVLEGNHCITYAPYFGLDIQHMRKWFEFQFTGVLSWSNFGEMWQFDHIVPVAYFDSNIEQDLMLCWNFTNLRVESYQKNKERVQRPDVLAAKKYFEDLYHTTSYDVCKKMLDKIETIQVSEILETTPQREFLTQNKDFLDFIKDYSMLEFELLNRGRTMEEVRKEMDFIKNLKLG